MKSKPEQTIQEYLKQFLEWSDRVDRVLLAIGSKNIEEEEILQLALSRALEVCGEICGKLLAQYPEWSEPRRSSGLDDAYRLRNRISHGYDTVDAKLLMAIAVADLPELRSKITGWLNELNG
jgi:uncharacterized protein with HEPN domain